MKFCVYEHWRPDKNICFYVGKGTRKRAYSLTRKENPRYGRVVEKLLRSGLKVDVRIVGTDLTEEDAFKIEIDLIARHRTLGIELLNLTRGGEGSSGCTRSEEFRQKIREFQTGRPKPSMRGKKLSDDHKAKIAPIGRPVSETTRAKISAAQKGKPRPELIGRKFSEETLERMRNRLFTDEHRKRISDAKKGKPKSPEHRAKLADAARAAHQRKIASRKERQP
jgi:hypothetical protein